MTTHSGDLRQFPVATFANLLVILAEKQRVEQLRDYMRSHSLSVGIGNAGSWDFTKLNFPKLSPGNPKIPFPMLPILPAFPGPPVIEGSRWWRSAKVGGVFTF